MGIDLVNAFLTDLSTSPLLRFVGARENGLENRVGENSCGVMKGAHFADILDTYKTKDAIPKFHGS